MVIGVWLKVGVVEWLISIMSVDKHSADGAHTQDCVTQQEVPLLPLAARCLNVWLHVCNTLVITGANSVISALFFVP